MVHEQEKESIRTCLAALNAGLEGFTSRPAQLHVVAAVANALARCRESGQAAVDGGHLQLIEAGTGVGKSFGALVPALVMARSRRKHLVVSTSTVALQHQYADKDVPTLQRLLPFAFTAAVAKGRRRYACIAKLNIQAAAAGQADLVLGSSVPSAGPEHKQVNRQAILTHLVETFQSGRWNGDRDELPTPVGDDVWASITTDRQGCTGRYCPDFAACPFYAARQRIRDADLVIANHDLVLAALRTDMGGVLPPVEETLYVVDEAHSLAAKAIDHASAKHALRGAREWVAGAAEAVRDAVLALRLDAALLRDADASAQTLSDDLESLHRRITATRGLDEKPARRFKGRTLPAWARAIGENLHAAAYDFQQTLAAVRAAILGRVAREPALATRVLSALGFYATKVDNLIDAWDLMLADDSKTGVPIARWVERYDDASNSPDILVCAAPITGSDRLRHLLWDRAAGAVLMSATLRSCGSFEPFLRQTGLAGFSGLGCLQVDSPFDYRSNARLMIPAVRADPTDTEAHTLEVGERLPELVNTRGTLVLFASARQMRAVHARLPEDLREITLLQGTMPKMQMLARHRAAIDRGERSILFGLQSLAEGVDLPGELCTHVICIKLPFSKADSPLEEARHEWLEAQGRSAFLEVSVPEAALRLKQQLGRLLRTTDDHGTATILDRRIVTRRWGRLLLRGLPDFELVIERVSGHASSQVSAERP